MDFNGWVSALAEKNFVFRSGLVAMECLEKAYEVHDSNLPYLLLPICDSLREEPRFQDLAKKIKLPYK